jgi:DNA polymerase III alpha subunit
MRLDKFKNPIFSSNDLFEAIYQGNTDHLHQLMVDEDDDIRNLEKISDIQFLRPPDDANSIQEYDTLYQSVWFIPPEYQAVDIKSRILSKCNTDIEITRVQEEFVEYERRNLLNLLKWLQYFVDTCRQHNICWGVGRGSSTASYILYLIGVHKIDSILYELDWKEFLR